MIYLLIQLIFTLLNNSLFVKEIPQTCAPQCIEVCISHKMIEKEGYCG